MPMCLKPSRVDTLINSIYLDPDELLQLGAGYGARLDQYLAQLLVPIAVLQLYCLFQLLRSDPAALAEDIAQPVAPIHDGGVANPTVFEEDVPQARPVRYGQAPALAPKRQQLEHIG